MSPSYRVARSDVGWMQSETQCNADDAQVFLPSRCQGDNGKACPREHV